MEFRGASDSTFCAAETNENLRRAKKKVILSQGLSTSGLITLLYDEYDGTKVITKNVHRDLLVMSNP